MVEALAEERAKVGVNFVLYPEAADGLVGSRLRLRVPYGSDGKERAAYLQRLADRLA
jgi:hypothetical protein